MATHVLNLGGTFEQRVRASNEAVKQNIVLVNRLRTSVQALNRSYLPFTGHKTRVDALTASFRSLSQATTQTNAALLAMHGHLAGIAGLTSTINRNAVVLGAGARRGGGGPGGAYFYGGGGGTGNYYGGGAPPRQVRGRSPIPYVVGGTAPSQGYSFGGYYTSRGPQYPYSRGSSPSAYPGGYVYGNTGGYGSGGGYTIGGAVGSQGAGNRGGGGRRGTPTYPRGVNVGRGFPFIPFVGSPGLLAAYGGALAIGGIISHSSRFEHQQARISAIQGRTLDDPASKLLAYNIRDFARESLFTPTQVSSAVSKLVRGGYKGQNALNAVKALQGITLLNPDTTLEQAASLSLNLFKRHGVNTSSFSAVQDAADLITHASTSSRLTLNDLITDSKYSLRYQGLPQTSLAAMTSLFTLGANAGVFGPQQYRIYTRATSTLFTDKERGEKISKLLNADQNILLNRQGELQSAGASSYGFLSAIADYMKKRAALPSDIRKNVPNVATQLKKINLPPTSIGPTIATAMALADKHPELIGFSGEYVEKRATDFFASNAKGKSKEAVEKMEKTVTGFWDLFKASLEDFDIAAGKRGTLTNTLLRLTMGNATSGIKGITKGMNLNSLDRDLSEEMSKHPLTKEQIEAFKKANPEQWRILSRNRGWEKSYQGYANVAAWLQSQGHTGFNDYIKLAAKRPLYGGIDLFAGQYPREEKNNRTFWQNLFSGEQWRKTLHEEFNWGDGAFWHGPKNHERHGSLLRIKTRFPEDAINYYPKVEQEREDVYREIENNQSSYKSNHEDNLAFQDINKELNTMQQTEMQQTEKSVIIEDAQFRNIVVTNANPNV